MLWLKLDELPIDRVAASLAESAIFLSLSYLEGLGLPPLEAMASGCVVVGYHGYGGLEYATQENGFWCEEQDPIACIEKLKEVLPMIHRGDDKIKQVVEAGFRTAAKYTPQRQEQELIQFMNRVMQGG
jgi:glycosyltransferase involved in cell wall biosynthesis